MFEDRVEITYSILGTLPKLDIVKVLRMMVIYSSSNFGAFVETGQRI